MATVERTGNTDIRIGEVNGDHVAIRVIGRMHPNADDYWDGNWLVSPINLKVGGFRGEIPAGLRLNELASFRKALEELHSSLRGEAVLTSIEGWIQLRVQVDLRGSLQVSGKALERPGTANALTFTIDGLDQSYLAAVISAIGAVEAKLPLRGQPDHLEV